LQVDRLRAKLEKNLGSIADMTRLPGALFIVDTMREHIAVKEAQKLNIPIFAMVDTNSDPRPIDFVIPSNDDASKSIEVIMTQVTNAVAEGLAERKADKHADKEEEEENTSHTTRVIDDEDDSSTVVAKAPTAAKTEKKAEPAKKAREIEETPAAAEVKDKATPKKEKQADPDDLTKVEGIGPKAAEALVNAGLGTYAKLAKSTPEEIKEVLTDASSRMAHLDPGSWPKQAGMAAEGKWDELNDWQDKAKAGIE
jgi:small subunit ribosomal protein S2